MNGGRPFIGLTEDAPEYHRYNQYIKAGYRINYFTWRATLWSLFQCHNETINVWTHFAGFWASFVGLIFLFCNYDTAKVLMSLDESALEEAQVSRSEVEGYDLGLIHSQRAEFNMLYLSLKSWVTSPASNETDAVSLANSDAEL